MKKVFITYVENSEQVKFENGKMLVPAENSMAIEIDSPSLVKRALKLFPAAESIQPAAR